ncbi:hypothetical protein RF679_03270 [Undibacterium cyanobacteriorum]|uniref:DUF1508 domain-containing protein n=1 Tax=Undibacterium cyanobacteriorum TaxID=3073561 RepID=A0ABY9RMU4_9BURK|nr:hypothetical protein [Undibacterium sp. 20NA77.5]WMW81311.1 hypothetical protein RF679_03270 [Undibacterium sp. 20NA77.5]
MSFLSKRILAFLPGSVLVVFSTLTIEREDKESLVLDADGWRFEFNKVSKLIFRSGRLVTSFGSIQSVDVEHYVNGKRFEWCVLKLTLQDGRKIFVGRSINSAELSIVAAHIADAVSRSVRTIEKVGF